MITVMAAITTMVAITAVRLTGTAAVSTTAAETTNRSTGTANRCTPAPRGMVADGGSGSARYGFRCNRHITGGSPALVARPLLLLGVVHRRVNGRWPGFAESAYDDSGPRRRILADQANGFRTLIRTGTGPVEAHTRGALRNGLTPN
jgi:hypothetical protein